MRTLIPWIPVVVIAFSSCRKEELPAPTPAPPSAPAAEAPAASDAAVEAPAASAAPAEAPAASDAATEAPAASAPAAEAAAAEEGLRGAITGEVKLEGTPPEMQPLKRGVDPVCARTAMKDEQVLVQDGRLENVAVWVSQGAVSGPAPAGPAKLEQLECMYRPRVQVIREGQGLEIHNADPTLHNIRAVREGKALFNKAQLPKAPPIVQDLGPGQVVQVKCDVHPWMKAFVVVAPHGYSDVTGKAGKFSIRGLPDGTYTLTAWHELYGQKTARVTLQGGKSTPVIFSFSAQDR